MSSSSSLHRARVSKTRLIPNASSFSSYSDGDTTNLTFNDLNRIAVSYPWPKGITLCLPVAGGVSSTDYPDSFVVHEESLKAGFRLPIPPFIREFLTWTELCPAQISPNSWQNISAYGILSWMMSKEPSFKAMQYLFSIKDTGKVFSVYPHNLDFASNPSKVCNWKKNWFLVKKGDEFDFDFDFPIRFGVGVELRKGGVDEIKDNIPSEAKDFKDCFLRLEEYIKLPYDQLVSWENLEKAGLSLPHPRQSLKPRQRSIKSIISKQNRPNSCRSVGVSKKRTLGACSSLGKEKERPTKKRFNDEQPIPKSPIHNLGIATDSPDYLASSLTLEEANGLLKRATVNADAVSVLWRLPDQQASAELARAVALQVYHANNMIEKHEKLLSSHLGSHAKLEGLEEEKKELKRNEESMKTEIQSLKERLRKTEEENAGNLKKVEEENAENLKKAQEENAEQRRKVMELEKDLAEARDIREQGYFVYEQDVECKRKQIRSLEDSLKKTKEENAELSKKIMELEMVSKARDLAKQFRRLLEPMEGVFRYP